MKIILGSASPRRQKLLQDWGYKFDVMNPQIDERSIRSKDFRSLPLMVAKAKAANLKAQVTSPAILITCDTVVVHDGKLREKPKDEKEAREFLQAYGSKPAEVICGVVVTHTGSGQTLDGVDSAKVYFHKIPEPVIDELVKSGIIMDWAGAFHPAHPSIKPHIALIEGETGTVMGLPRMLTEKLIRELSKV